MPRCVPVEGAKRREAYSDGSGWYRLPCATHKGRTILFDEWGQMHDGYRHSSIEC